MALEHPTIRGRRYSRRDATVTVIGRDGAEIFVDIGDLSYSGAPLEEAYVTAEGMIVGRTRGDIGAVEATLQMSKQAFHVLVERLMGEGIGYKEAEFSILIAYSGPGLPTIIDTLENCRIVTDEESHSVGPDPLWVDVGIRALNCKRDGNDAVAGMLG